MIAIKFPSTEIQDDAVGFLAGSYPMRLLGTGEVLVPEPALDALRGENFTFEVVGNATYEQMVPIRSNAAKAVQRRQADSPRLDGQGGS